MLVNTIGYLSEAAYHHPDLAVTWGKLWVKLQTHSSGGITDKDFALAREIEDHVLWRPEPDSALEGTPNKFVHSSTRRTGHPRVRRPLRTGKLAPSPSATRWAGRAALRHECRHESTVAALMPPPGCGSPRSPEVVRDLIPLWRERTTCSSASESRREGPGDLSAPSWFGHRRPGSYGPRESRFRGDQPVPPSPRAHLELAATTVTPAPTSSRASRSRAAARRGPAVIAAARRGFTLARHIDREGSDGRRVGVDYFPPQRSNATSPSACAPRPCSSPIRR